MSAKTIKSALGLLQDDPDSTPTWQTLREEVESDPGMGQDELAKLLEAARHAYEGRREYEPVQRLLEIELVVAKGTGRERGLLAELARVLDEELMDDAGARAAYERMLVSDPKDGDAADALERTNAKRTKWRELLERYVHEAQGAGDSAFRSSLLVSAAEVVFRYGRSGGEQEPLERIVSLLRDALQLDPKNRRAEMLLERMLRDDGRWDDVAETLEKFASEATQKDEKIAGWLRLARTFAKKLKSADRAAAAYERVLDVAPGNAEAASFLSDYFTTREMWEHLVALYEGQLSAGALRGKEEESGAILQIAMVHWRMRGRPEAAEPWFERLRKLDPAHPGMLSFFREWCLARGETARLAAIFSDAQRATPDGPERGALAAEIAKLAEEGANAQKAIEQWRAVLRQDARNKEARDALKRLYRQTASWNALTDLLRQELERLASDDAAGRLPVLRDIAVVYRDEVKSDSALVTVLTQIVQLDPTDLAERARARARVRVAAALARSAHDAGAPGGARVRGRGEGRAVARDRAALARSVLERAERGRGVREAARRRARPIARRSIGSRSSTPSAARTSRSSISSRKRPSRPPRDPSGASCGWRWRSSPPSASIIGAQAVALYKKVLDEEPASAAALDALEKQAERDKDFATVAEVLERRTRSRARRGHAPGDPPEARRHLLRPPARSREGDERVAARPGAAAGPRKGAARPARQLRRHRATTTASPSSTPRTSDWEGLVEVLSGAADKATDPDLKVDLSFRCATVYSERLNAPERAFRAYERVLSVRPDDARAAAALAPLYEKDEKWGRLPALYEILLGQSAETDEKLALLDKLVQVTGLRLQDRATAFAWATRAYELAPAREGAVAAFESAARAAELWQGFVDALTARLEVLEGSRGAKKGKKKKDSDAEGGRREELRALRAKLAEVFAREMGRIDEAVQAYRQLVEEDETDELAVQTLDRVLREADRRDDLRWLFDLRVERANTALKLDLLGEWALLEEEAFGSPENAVALYRRMLELVSHHGTALRSLARLLRAQGDATGAAEVIALDRDQREGMERAAREIELAKLFVDPLHRYLDALGRRRAGTRALAQRPARHRGRRAAARHGRDAGARRGDPRAGLRSRPAPRCGRPRSSRCSSPRPPRATIASRSTVASPTCTPASSTTPTARSTSSRARPASSRPTCRSGIASPGSRARPGARRTSRSPSWPPCPSKARRGSPSAWSSISRSAPRTSSTRSSATSIARRRTSSECSRASRATSAPSTG